MLPCGSLCICRLGPAWGHKALLFEVEPGLSRIGSGVNHSPTSMHQFAIPRGGFCLQLTCSFLSRGADCGLCVPIPFSNLVQ